MEREQWINEIMDSTNKIVKVSPDDALFFKIQNQLDAKKTVAKEWVWLAAASVVILVTINIKLVYKEIKTVKEANEIALITTISDSNQLYK
ncbi:MAG: hypothetical protein V4497_10665 [Bacteroidota bacterium]